MSEINGLTKAAPLASLPFMGLDFAASCSAVSSSSFIPPMALSDSESSGTTHSCSLAFCILFFFSGTMVSASLVTKMGLEIVFRGVIANLFDVISAEAAWDWVVARLQG
jgi:hypothetical protein